MNIEYRILNKKYRSDKLRKKRMKKLNNEIQKLNRIPSLKTSTFSFVFCCLLSQLFGVSSTHASDWPQVAANPARTSFVKDELKGELDFAWVRDFYGEGLFNCNHPIIVGSNVYIGTQKGIAHAIDKANGKDKWTKQLSGAIVHGLASDGKSVFVPTFDGSVHALDCKTGKVLWSLKLSRRGFSSAPLLMDGALFLTCRDGKVYGVSLVGKKMWEMDSGSPIVHTPAGDQGIIVFVNEGMMAYGLNAKTGKVVWKFGPLNGRSVRDYWPVIYKGKVVIRTAGPGPRALFRKFRPLQKLMQPKAKNAEAIIKEQDHVSDYQEKHPYMKTGYVLDLKTGKEPYKPDLLHAVVNTGTVPPPILAGDGRLYTFFRSSAGESHGKHGIEGITRCGLGHFNIDTGKFEAPILMGGPGVDHAIKGERCVFELTSDETVTMLAAGNVVAGIRCDGSPGFINSTNKKKIEIKRGCIPPLPRNTDMLPGGNAIATDGKYFIWVKSDSLLCLKGK